MKLKTTELPGSALDRAVANQVNVVWTATMLRDCWAIRPKGQLGTCGFYPIPWTVRYTKRLPKGMEVEA